MGYQSNQYGNGGGGGYNRQPQNNYNNGGGGGYNKSQYTPPQKKEFNLEEEANKYTVVYQLLVATIKEAGIPVEDVKDYLGGWTTSLKLSLDKS